MERSHVHLISIGVHDVGCQCVAARQRVAIVDATVEGATERIVIQYTCHCADFDVMRQLHELVFIGATSRHSLDEGVPIGSVADGIWIGLGALAVQLVDNLERMGQGAIVAVASVAGNRHGVVA